MSSRYEHASKQTGHTVAIGWDTPMQTYFAQVEREQNDDDERNPIVLWLGGQVREMATPMDLIGPLGPWLDVTPEMVGRLKADRAADLDRGPTALQRDNLAVLAAGRNRP